MKGWRAVRGWLGGRHAPAGISTGEIQASPGTPPALPHLLFDINATPEAVRNTPVSRDLFAGAADALIAVASVQCPDVALESYRVASNYGSTDAVAFYGATLFFLGLMRSEPETVSDDVLAGLAWMETAMLQGAPMASGLLQEAVSVTPPAALAAWHERSGLVAQ